MAEIQTANHLKFYPTPASLQCNATYTLARHYLYNELNRDAKNIRKQPSFEAFRWSINNEAKFVRYFKPRIPDKDERQKVINCIQHMISFMSEWVSDHLYYVFEGQSTSHLFLKFMPDFVWGWDGHINYVRTAEKLISGTLLNTVEKYGMMCLYCMEDDIRRMYDTYDWVERCLKMKAFRNNICAYYWDCILEEDEPENPDENDDRSLEKYILDFEPKNPAAVEYFFVQLEDDERFEYGVELLPELSTDLIKLILPKFTESELRRILDKCLPKYMVKLMTSSDSEQHPLELWNFAKNSTRGKIYLDMMNEVMENDPFYYEGIYPKWWGEFGLDVWRNTPARLKQFVFRQQPEPSYAFILKWNTWYSKVTGKKLRDDTTLLLILSDATVEYRRSFWMKEWTGLITDSQPNFLIQLMNLCLSGPREVEEFKTKILKSRILRQHLSNVFTKKCFFDLNRF